MAGMKKISLENWNERDTIHDSFVGVLPSGKAVPLKPDDWTRLLLASELSERVPENVNVLFEVARGSMVYGYYFYPLYALGTEQLFRVVETAVSEKCRELGAPNSKSRFADKIRWLATKKAIQFAEGETLEMVRNLRNLASHPESQAILPPAVSVDMVDRITNLINALFAEPKGGKSE